MMTIAMGLVVVLLVSGIIEAFVTPSPLPTWARIGIGARGLAGVPRPMWSCWAAARCARVRPATCATTSRATRPPSSADTRTVGRTRDRLPVPGPSARPRTVG